MKNSINLNELRLKQRKSWGINPKTRVVNNKRNSRKTQKQKFQKDIDNE